jgi:ATP-dependent RNA helicase DDX52/ROK1
VLTAPKSSNTADAAGGTQSVQVSGGQQIQPTTGFAEFLGAAMHSKQLLHNISELGFSKPTVVQQYAMPGVRSGNDMYVIAPTGSGKTLGFLLPGMSFQKTRLLSHRHLASATSPTGAGAMIATEERSAGRAAGPSVVVINPTRELAAQSHRVLKLLIAHTSIRGSLLSKSTVAGTDFSKVDVLIATPLLLVKMIRDGKVRWSRPSADACNVAVGPR